MDGRIGYIFEGLDADKILRIVVGNRWSILEPKEWPRRVRERTKWLTGEPLDLREDEPIDVGLSKIREWWEKTGRFLSPIPLLRIQRDK